MDTYMTTTTTSSSMSSSQVLPITSTSNYLNYSSNQNYNNFNNSNNNNNLNSTTKTATTKIGTSNKDFLISSSTSTLSSASSSLQTNSINSLNQHQNFHELSENKNSINFNNNANNQTTTNNLIINNSSNKNYSINNSSISTSSTNGSNNSNSFDIYESLNNQNIINKVNKNLSVNEASISDSNNLALNSSSSQLSSFSSSSSLSSSSSSSSPLNNSNLDLNTNKNYQQSFSSPTTTNSSNIDYYIKQQTQNNQRTDQNFSKILQTPSPNFHKTALAIDSNSSSAPFNSQAMLKAQSNHSMDKNHFNATDYYSIENQINHHYQPTDTANMNGFQNNFNINSNWHQSYYSNDNNSHDYYYSNNIGIDNANTYLSDSNLNRNQMITADKTTQNNSNTDSNNNQTQFNNYNGYTALNSNYDYNSYAQMPSLSTSHSNLNPSYFNNNQFNFHLNNSISNSNSQNIYQNQLTNEQKAQQPNVLSNPNTANQSNYLTYQSIDDVKTGIPNASKSNTKLANDYSISGFNGSLLNNANHLNSNSASYLDKKKFNNDNGKILNFSSSSSLSSTSPISNQNINKSSISLDPSNNFNDIKLENASYSNFSSDDYSSYYQSKQIANSNLEIASNSLNSNIAKTVINQYDINNEKLLSNNNSESYLSNSLYKMNKNKLKKSSSLKLKILNSNKRKNFILNSIKSENKAFLSSLCNVCDKPSTDGQYGTEPCEACKNFFKRYSKKTNKNPPCNENCDQNKDKRLSCASCRYEKCLAVGMKPSNKSDIDENSSDLLYKQQTFSVKAKYTQGYENIKKETNENDTVQKYNLINNDLNELNPIANATPTGSSLLTTSDNKSSSINYNNQSLRMGMNGNENLVLSTRKKLIVKIAKEIEIKKKLIRIADSEQAIKEHLIQLTLNIANYFLNINDVEASENRDRVNNGWLDNSDKHSASLLNSMNKNSLFEVMKRPLLVAYSYLIDNMNSNDTFKMNSQELKTNILVLFSCKLTPYEMNLTNQLHKIYSSYSNVDKAKPQSDFQYDYQFYDGLNYNENNYFNGSSNLQSNTLIPHPNNSVQLTESFKYNDDENVSSSGLSELKMLHFLLLLFSCYLNMDEFYLENYNSTQTNDCAGTSNISSSLLNLNINKNSQNVSVDAYFCQKSILKLIDLICTDSIVKTKILLSVSDLDLI